jgi:predicted site-specific integrase-resolvase
MVDASTFIAVRQFAEAFGVDDDTVRLWCQAGKVPGAFQTPGGRWRIPETSIAIVRERGTPTPAAESAA